MRYRGFSSTTAGSRLRAVGPTHRLVLGGGTALVLALAGCGGSSSSKPLSKTELVAKVNAICVSSLAESKKIPQPPDFATNPVAAAAYLDKALPILEGNVGKLKALKPESSVKADYENYVSDVVIDLNSVKSATAKSHAKDSTGLQDLRDEAPRQGRHESGGHDARLHRLRGRVGQERFRSASAARPRCTRG